MRMIVSGIFQIGLIATSVATISASANAGIEHGNGGDVVVCPARPVETRVRLLDYVEAERRGFQISIGSGTVEQRVERALSYLDPIDPGRARYFRTRAAAFLREAEFLNGQVLQDVDDSSHVTLDAGCHLEQIAVRVPPRFPDLDRSLFLVNGDLWSQLDTTHKAGLVLHEVLFEDVLFSTWDYRDRPVVSPSPLARYLTGVLSAGLINAADYDLLLSNVRLTPGRVVTTDWHGREYDNIFFLSNDVCLPPYDTQTPRNIRGCLYRPMRVQPANGPEYVAAAQSTKTYFEIDGRSAKPVSGILAREVTSVGLRCGHSFFYSDDSGLVGGGRFDTERCWYEVLIP